MSSGYDISTVRSGFVPDREQRSSIRATVVSQEARLDLVDVQLRELKTKMDLLHSQHKAITEAISIEQGLLAPIRRLSPEIMQIIFKYTLGEITSFAPDDVPILLTHVCANWRRIALKTPRLWNEIYAHAYSPGVNNKHALFQMWLQNAGKTPLNMDLDMEKLKGSALATMLLNLGTLHRCRRLSIQGSKEKIMDGLPVRVTLTLLESLCIMASRLSRNEDEWTTTDHHWEFPNLRSLRLYESGVLLSKIVITPNNLRELTIKTETTKTPVPYSVWIDLWMNCSNLESVNVDLDSIAPGHDIGAPERFDCEGLKVLKLGLGWSCEPRDILFLERLWAPNLVYLRLSTNGWILGNPMYSAIYSVVSQSSKLKRLSLVGIDLETVKARELLNAATELETIKVSSNSFINALFPPQDSPPDTWACPALSNLKIKGDRFSQADVLALVGSRARTGMGGVDSRHYLTTVKAEGPIYKVLRRVQTTELNIVEGRSTYWGFA